MKLQKILNRIQKLHPKEIDLSLDRIKKLCEKLGNPQDNLKYISVIGTNGKYSTIQAIRAILKDANINCNIYTSPHIQKINERFVYNDEEISDENLVKLLTEVEDINAGETITYFEILTAAYFYNARKFKNNINLIESGLFHRADACSIIKSNLASIITPIGLDHLDWLPKNKLPYIVCFTDPTAGGITASFAMLGDIHFAEPGCLIAFAGKRVIQATVKEELSPDFQTAEFVEKHGFVDKVVNRKELTNEVGKLLEILLKKNSEVNSGLSNETSKIIEQSTKAAS